MALPRPELAAAPFVKPLIFHKNLTHRQSDGSGRNFQKRRSLSNALCHPFILFHRDFALWITSVEKPVENVENFDFSTTIFPVSSFPDPVQKFRLAETESPRKWELPSHLLKTQPAAWATKRFGFLSLCPQCNVPEPDSPPDFL